jgi:signal transduction histidine kinase/ActR/RegA family two-component response regulator
MTIFGLCFDGSVHGLAGHHQPALVALSYVVAAFASFTALEITERLHAAQGRARPFWRLGAAVALGGGIWSMHFVAMLAFKIPIAQAYDPQLTFISGLVAIAAVAMGMGVFETKVTFPRIARAGLLVGVGVAAMHYCGMSALKVPGQIYYRPGLFALSVVIAVAAATAALWLASRSHALWRRVAAALVMAVAICGMHYTGMAATVIVAGPGVAIPVTGVVHAEALAWSVAGGVGLILMLALACAFVDRRFQRQAALNEQLRELNAVLGERTRRLTQALEALEDARRSADAASQAKTDFLANMSHEIRTPLTGIIGFAKLLEAAPDLSPEAERYASRISTASATLLAVVNDILDFSRIEAGQMALEERPFEPETFIRETVELAGAQAQAKRIALRVSTRRQRLPDALVADAPRLRQILLNLITNAIKFTERGGVRVFASYAETAQMLKIEVKDTGVGISAERLPMIFDRFSQADGSVNRRYGGTGLGLAICQGLAQAMGGEIGVESAEGRGSTFWFTIAARAASAVEAPEGEETVRDQPPARILIVDDVAANRELVGAMLAAFGHRLAEAAGGAEAVEMASRAPFDLILMDMQMPGMDGLAATHAIRQSRTINRATPIIALSANVMPGQIEACLRAGMDDHVGKPIVPAELVAKVARWTAQAVDEDRARTA